MPMSEDTVEVIQADREAAIAIGSAIRQQLLAQGIDLIVEVSDAGIAVQAFARHRLAYTPKADVPVARGGDAIEALTRVVQNEAQNGADSPVDYGDAERIVRAVLAALTATQPPVASPSGLTPLSALELICGDIYSRWDQDQRSGKLLTALSGMMSPGYDSRVDLVRTALSRIDGALSHNGSAE